jgi:hypothetical protein
MPLFDSREYSWSNITINLGGKKLGGVQSVKYKYGTDKERVFGSGNKARAIQSGNTEVDGEVILLQSEYEKMAAAARVALGDPLAKVTELPGVDMVVAYTNGAKITTDVVYGLSFTEVEKGMAQNDKYMKITMPFLALDVKESA